MCRVSSDHLRVCRVSSDHLSPLRMLHVLVCLRFDTKTQIRSIPFRGSSPADACRRGTFLRPPVYLEAECTFTHSSVPNSSASSRRGLPACVFQSKSSSDELFLQQQGRHGDKRRLTESMRIIALVF